MMNHESKRPVTIEDLLHFKRAERPTAEFWTEFDRELRAKQLAALVEKRPWWRSFPNVFRGLARYHLPLGATAVLAVTLVSLRDSHPPVTVPTVSDSAPAATASTSAPSTSVLPPASAAVAVVDESPVVEAAPASVNPTETSSVASSTLRAPGELSRLVPLLEVGETENRLDLRSAEQALAVGGSVANVASLSTVPSSFETRALPARAPQEPLAQMSNPAERRRSRFASAFSAVAMNTSPTQTQRVARRLSDEQLYDSIHRFGASGNTVSIRF